MFKLPYLRNLVTSSLAATVATGCGGDDGGGAEGAGEAAAAVMEHPVDAATAGSITGLVVFTGTPSEGEMIDMSEEPACADVHATPPMHMPAIVGTEGGLANVFIHLSEGLDPSLQFPAEEAAVLDQVGCEYIPHVVALSTDQQLTVRNSDPVLHNVNTTPTENRGFNRSQPQAGMEFQTSFPTAEVMIPVRCDVHGWMESYIGVTAHPYHAVTGEDGSFALERLPPGTYTLEAWHELYGTVTQSVVVPESGEAAVMFEFDESMAGRHVPLGPTLIISHKHDGTATAVRATQQ